MFKKLLITGLLATSFVSVYAASPTLSLSSTGQGDNVTLTATGDPSTTVVLNYFSSVSSSTQAQGIGSTDVNGNFVQTISTGLYNISSSVPVYVTLNGYLSPSVTWPYTMQATSQAFSLNQSNISVAVNQQVTVGITGNGSYYLLTNSNSSVASAYVSGSNLIINGLTAGTSVITVCQSYSQCASVTVTVTGGTTTVSQTGIILNPIITVGQLASFTLSGNTSPYYVTNSNNAVTSATVSGNTLYIQGQGVGVSSLSLCSSNGYCMPISVTVNVAPVAQAVTQTQNTSTYIPLTTPSSKYYFANAITYGAKGQEVIELQKRLHEEGFFNGNYVGNYGDATVAAVKKYQKSQGLSQLGNLGPATRAALNR